MFLFRFINLVILCISFHFGNAQEVITLRKDTQTHQRLGLYEDVFLLKNDSLFNDSSDFPWCRVKIARNCSWLKDNTCGLLEYTIVANNYAFEKGYNAAFYHGFKGSQKKDTIEFSFIRLPNHLLPITPADTIPTTTILNFKDRKTMRLTVAKNEFTLPGGAYLNITLDEKNMSKKAKRRFEKRFLKRNFLYTSRRNTDYKDALTVGVASVMLSPLTGFIIVPIYTNEPVNDLPRLSAEIIMRDLKKYKIVVPE